MNFTWQSCLGLQNWKEIWTKSKWENSVLSTQDIFYYIFTSIINHGTFCTICLDLLINQMRKTFSGNCLWKTVYTCCPYCQASLTHQFWFWLILIDFFTSNQSKVYKKQMLQAASTDLLNPLVPKDHNSECQNQQFPLQIKPVKVS